MYFYEHDNQVEEIGSNEHEALNTLQSDYDLDLEEIFMLCVNGYIYEK